MNEHQETEDTAAALPREANKKEGPWVRASKVAVTKQGQHAAGAANLQPLAWDLGLQGFAPCCAPARAPAAGCAALECDRATELWLCAN